VLHLAESTGGHNTLFDVYKSKDGKRTFAMGTQGDDFIVVEQGGTTAVRRLELSQAVGLLAKRIRTGYVKSPAKMFFNSCSERFCFVHPDLDWTGACWVLAATPPDIERAAVAVADIARKAPATVLMVEEIDRWLTQQRRNVAHVVAFDDHAIWPLALAQAALEKGWGLRAVPGKGAVPDSPPSAAPIHWRAWLQLSFTKDAVTAAQAGMGWTPEARIFSDTGGPQEKNLSAFI
jgi:hypothetical protein